MSVMDIVRLLFLIVETPLLIAIIVYIIKIERLLRKKNNYAALQNTVLYSIGEDGLVHYEGATWKRDRDFTQEYAANTAPSKRRGCEDWITQQLQGKRAVISSLYDDAEDAGYSSATLRRAIEELSKAGKIRRWCEGFGKGKIWYIETISPCDT